MSIRTPRGRWLGRKPDRADPRDRHYGASRRVAAAAPPSKVDLRSRLPAAYDQGSLSSCGANAGAALMACLFPEAGPFSRLQIYYDVRIEEGSPSSDSGVETRDVLKVLQQVGAGPESIWPYVTERFAIPPPRDEEAAARRVRISSYERLTAESDFYTCLATGSPFVLGIECYDSIDSENLARTGVMPTPDPNRERIVGGHDVLVVGYDLAFKASSDFKASGIDQALVSDRALLIRNSWGTDFGLAGHFWLPVEYASNPSTGGDSWCGHR